MVLCVPSWSRRQTHTLTHHLVLPEQLLVLLSVTPELLGQLHLAVYGLGQVLGQDVLMSLRRAAGSRQQAA